MDASSLPVGRLWIVRMLSAAAWATWVAAALSPWYTSTRVDLEPETMTTLGVAVVAVVPLVVATAAAVRCRSLPWWSAVVALGLAAPSVAVALAYPGFLEAANTDTDHVVEQGPALLLAAVLLAVTAVAVASRLRRVRPAAAGSSG